MRECLEVAGTGDSTCALAFVVLQQGMADPVHQDFEKHEPARRVTYEPAALGAALGPQALPGGFETPGFRAAAG